MSDNREYRSRRFAQLVGLELKGEFAKHSISQTKVAEILGHSKGGYSKWIILLYLVVFRFGLPECLEIRKRWYFNAFAILQVVTGYDCMERNVTVFVCGLYAE